jgi:hypothetical protein
VAEREDLLHAVALAKEGLLASPAARARVRARLGEATLGSKSDPSAGAAAASASASGAVRPAWRALGWMLAGVSVGLCAGYWLGYQRVGAALAERDATLDSLHASATSGLATPSHDANASVTSPEGSRAAAEGAAAPTAASTAPAAIGDVSHGAGASQPGRVARRAEGVPPALETLHQRSASAGGSRTAPRPAPDGESRDRFAAEVALLGRAERAIRGGEAALALALLEQLDREFPSSPLRVERAAARVLARCEASRSGSAAERAAAQSAARELLSQGSSVYAGRVRELCGLADESVNVASEEAPRRGH